MSPGELNFYYLGITKRFQDLGLQIGNLKVASRTKPSTDYESDALAEAYFLRAYTSYERDLEALFIHYVSGGRSLNGYTAKSFLNVQSEIEAEKVVYGSRKFLNWSSPDDTRTTAERFMFEGWPLRITISQRSQVLTDSTYLRNHIAHKSKHSKKQFDAVQRNLLRTERVFPITTGQLLRIRHSKEKKLHIEYFLDTMFETLVNLMMPVST